MIVLASSSPARRKLIKKCIRNAVVKKPRINEKRNRDEGINGYLKRITYLKAERFVRSGVKVISADTVIVFQNEIIGKPKDRKDAFEIFSRLRGNIHYCITAVTILDSYNYIFFSDYATIYMKNINDESIERYLDTKEYINRSGGYAIQGSASKFLEIKQGDIATITGLPVKKICKII